ASRFSRWQMRRLGRSRRWPDVCGLLYRRSRCPTDPSMPSLVGRSMWKLATGPVDKVGADLVDERRWELLVKRAVLKELSDRLGAHRVPTAPTGVVTPAVLLQYVGLQSDCLVYAAMKCRILVDRPLPGLRCQRAVPLGALFESDKLTPGPDTDVKLLWAVK